MRSLLAVLMLVMCVALPAHAQEQSAKDIEKLVSTLENPAERDAMVRNLKAILAARNAAEAEAEPSLMAGITNHVGRLGDDLLEAVATLRLAPRLVEWGAAQAGDPVARARWAEILLHLGGVLLAGWLAEQAARLGLSRVRRAAAPAEPGPWLVRVPLALARACIDLLPVAAFAAAGYGLVSLLHLSGNLRVAALMLVTAYVGVRLIMVTAHLLTAPHTPSLRLLAVDSETAEYLVIWTRRLAGVGLFGYFLADAARLLGLPKAGFNAVLKGLGFAIAIMLVVFILQNRAGVAAALRRAAIRWDWGGRMRMVCLRLADIWHVLAMAYVGAAYAVWAIPVKGGFEYMLRATLFSIVVMVAAGLVSLAVRRIIDRGFAVSQETKDRFPLLEARANRYLPVLHLAFRAVLVIVTVLAIMQAWGLETFHWMTSDLGRRVIASGLSIAAVLTGAALVWELVSGAIERYLNNADERSARARTLLPLVRNALMIALLVLVGLIVLSELGANIAPLLAGAGVIGIAIGFGSQKLVQDVITGAFILFEDTISVGDVVRLDAHAGTVEAMSIRAIRLRDSQGALHTIPFSSVGRVVNLARDFGYAVMDVGVAYHEDTDHVAEVLQQVGDELHADQDWAAQIMAPLEVLGIERFDPSAVVIRCRFKTVALQQWSVTREFHRRMKRRFNQLGIEMPLPQTKVWVAKDEPEPQPQVLAVRTSVSA